MTDSSMLISTQAETMPGITLSSYVPISRFGLQYELYAAEMSTMDDILYQGTRTSGRPRIGGMLVSIEPAGPASRRDLVLPAEDALFTSGTLGRYSAKLAEVHESHRKSPTESAAD